MLSHTLNIPEILYRYICCSTLVTHLLASPKTLLVLCIKYSNVIWPFVYGSGLGLKCFFPFHWRIGPLKVFWKQSTDSLPVNRLSILLLKHNGPSLLSQGPFHKDVGCSNLGHWQDISSTLIHNSKILCANSHLYKVTYSYFVRLGDMKSLDLNIANSNANTPVITL